MLHDMKRKHIMIIGLSMGLFVLINLTSFFIARHEYVQPAPLSCGEPVERSSVCGEPPADFGVIAGFPFKMMQIGGRDAYWQWSLSGVIAFDSKLGTLVTVSIWEVAKNLAVSYAVTLLAVVGYYRLKSKK